MKIHTKKKLYKRAVQAQLKAGKIPNAADGTWRAPQGTDGSMGRDSVAGARH